MLRASGGNGGSWPGVSDADLGAALVPAAAAYRVGRVLPRRRGTSLSSGRFWVLVVLPAPRRS